LGDRKHKDIHDLNYTKDFDGRRGVACLSKKTEGGNVWVRGKGCGKTILKSIKKKGRNGEREVKKKPAQPCSGQTVAAEMPMIVRSREGK